MSNNRAIQFLRGTFTNRMKNEQKESLADGQPFYETDTRKLYVGGTALEQALPVDGSQYDYVIRTQDDFNNFFWGDYFYYYIDKSKINTMLIVALPEDKPYKAYINARPDQNVGITLPSNVTRLDGFGNVTIEFDDLNVDISNQNACIKATSGSATSISNIRVVAKTESSSWNVTHVSATGFSEFSRVFNCTFELTLSNNLASNDLVYYPIGFRNCKNLTDCKVIIPYRNRSNASLCGYETCTNLTNCSCTLTYAPNRPSGANKALEASCYRSCSHLINCQGSNAIAATNSPSVFNGCSYCSMCTSPDVSNIWDAATAANYGAHKIDTNTCSLN